MKIALYIEDGLEQIVLTPDTETEKNILGKLHDGSREMSMKRGAFYENRGGWVRWKKEYNHTLYGGPDESDDSTIIVLRKTKGSTLTSPEQAP